MWTIFQQILERSGIQLYSLDVKLLITYSHMLKTVWTNKKSMEWLPHAANINQSENKYGGIFHAHAPSRERETWAVAAQDSRARAAQVNREKNCAVSAGARAAPFLCTLCSSLAGTISALAPERQLLRKFLRDTLVEIVIW